MIPNNLRAGDKWSWTDSFEYPATLWTLVHYFQGPNPFTASGSASGTDFVTTVLPAVSTDIVPGAYDWIARVTEVADATVVYTVAAGRLTVENNLATSTTDYRSFWRKVLDELEPVILGKAGTDQLSMSIGGRSLSRMNWDELLKVYDRALYHVASENGAQPSRVYIRFGAA
jgi:hypothetical protein